MKTLTIAAIFCLILCAVSYGQESPSAYDAAYAAWEQATHQSGSIEASVDAFSKLHTAWESAPPFERDHSAYYYAQAAVTTAARAPKEDAYQLLREAAKVVSEFPIVLSRGKSAKKFKDVASVHARVWSANQTDPFEGSPVGYEMARQGNGFVALQEAAEIDSAIAAGAESAVAGNEGLGLLLSLDKSGSIVQSLAVAITKGSGSIRSRLTAILKHEPAGPSGPSRFVRQEPEAFFAGQPKAGPPVTDPMASSQVPSHVLPQASKKPIDQGSGLPAAGEKPPSSMQWLLAAAVVVTALALLRLLLKKRK